MADVIVNADDMTAVADKIREKTQLAQGFRVKDMADAVGTLHGHISSARAMDTTPAAIVVSVFNLPELTQTSTASKRTDFSHAEAISQFALSELTFTATAALTE